MRSDYQGWLEKQGYDVGTIQAQLYRVARVEEFYGELDRHFDSDQCNGLIEELTYSAEDQRRGRANPTRIPFSGHARNNLASYKSAVSLYRRFCRREDVDKRNPPRPRPFQDREAGGRVADLSSRPLARGGPVRWVGPRTLVDFGCDGRAALQAMIEASPYRSVAQTVASLTLFSHPHTVRQTEGKALFPSIRNARRVGQIDVQGGRRVLLDDNKTPTDAFLWANAMPRRGPDTQFNHIYPVSSDPDAYTALPNICMTPAFIAKLTDTDRDVRRLLMYRSYELYGWTPTGHPIPERPEDYEILAWAMPLPAVADVAAVLRAAMATKPRSRTVMAAVELGWLFG